MSIKNNTISLQNLLKTVNSLPDAGGEQATPEISVNSSGLITATAGAKSSTYQLAFQPAKTITPSTTSQIAVSSGYYTGGNITVAGDSNLVAENIKSGVSIFGVEGTLEEGGGGSGGVVDDRFKDLIEGSLTSIEDDSITKVDRYKFYYNNYLTKISLPNCSTISTYAFAYCTKLTDVSIPKINSIPARTFYGCTALENIVLENVYDLTNYVFYGCTKLKFVDLQANYSGRQKKINTFTFSGCTNLKILILRNVDGTSVYKPIYSLVNTNAFDRTPFASGGTGGKCFVPSSLIDDYQNATNWSTLYAAGTCVFYPLEEYTKDGTAKGELDWDKINALDEGGAGE